MLWRVCNGRLLGRELYSRERKNTSKKLDILKKSIKITKNKLNHQLDVWKWNMVWLQGKEVFRKLDYSTQTGILRNLDFTLMAIGKSLTILKDRTVQSNSDGWMDGCVCLHACMHMCLFVVIWYHMADLIRRHEKGYLFQCSKCKDLTVYTLIAVRI